MILTNSLPLWNETALLYKGGLRGVIGYLNNPKLPTVFVYQLVEGQYQVQKFTGNDRIISTTFPELALTVKQVVAASQIQKL